jgi:cytochrome c
MTPNPAAKLPQTSRRVWLVAVLTTASVTGLGFMRALAEQSGAPQTGEAERGKSLFEKRCTGCHALDEEREGPRLRGVFGRKAGSVPGFDYSPGVKNLGITWDGATLEKWLSGPDAVVPETKMDFYVPKAQEREDLIAFLKSVGTTAK